MAKVKVTVTSSTKQAYNSAMLGVRWGGGGGRGGLEPSKVEGMFLLTRR